MHDVGDVCGTATLLRRAEQGDRSAWHELVDRNNGVVWGAARAFSATHVDAQDVYQATWLLLAENIGTLRAPEALASWLVTTARRESLRLVKSRKRESPAGVDTRMLDAPDDTEGPERKALRSVSVAKLARAFGQLSGRCQQLLRVVAMAPEASYVQVSEALGVARGTVGPKKIRCLAALRKEMSMGSSEEVPK